jgi:formylglycine-generating enzyme required for sulfatase activity
VIALLGGCVIVPREQGEAWKEASLDAELGLVAIPAGTFTMGSPKGEVGRGNDEAQHTVTLTHDFAIGATEVTQLQFEAFLGYDPNWFPDCGGSCPVEYVAWHEAAAFANAVSAEAGLAPCYGCTGKAPDWSCMASADPYTCEGYRLPTEAEWEYAARAGEAAAFSNGGNLVDGDDYNCEGELPLDNAELLDSIAWYCGNGDGTTHPAGELEPNAWGLYDASGNVWEWCHDWHGDYDGDATDPAGPETGSSRVFRGGSWDDVPRGARVAYRTWDDPGDRYGFLGLRLVRSMQP